MSVVVSALSKIYGQQHAVNNISFEVKSGEIVGFLGPNGAGKSTTMKIATGYLSPSSGTVSVQGYDVRTHAMDVRRNIGYLPEHNPLYLEMYVKEYLRFIGSLHQLRGQHLRQRVTEMIDICGLGREQHKKIGALSKGYRQRVGLAQSLIHNPPVLVLDEPTTGLDPNQILEIRQLIKTIGREKTVIFSTHIMQEVQAICQRAVIIHLGQIVADDTVESLRRQQGQTRLHLKLEAPVALSTWHSLPPIAEAQEHSPGHYTLTLQPDAAAATISRIAAQQGWVILEMQQEQQTLEHVFQALTQTNTP
ncbi:gliding motility-associated ABC transporter ATP-binding subunit GldA [Eisenibacter elegans]|jgi:ABC-2 type transport system ATP-binding protein|uniref:gliding motility-associated ABC transporter ATP-binding subunit GldA n=1 Tax=Eisenibacter elegans TaxID=997 RepID=UPI00040D652C|nr:gliding motility-associated ABC transporter ATP-binding subunit GldA [Eisenibacter elegans]